MKKFLEREAHKDQSYVDWAYDLLNDAVSAFHKQPFVTISQAGNIKGLHHHHTSRRDSFGFIDRKPKTLTRAMP